jgi:hypothetical protein
MPTPRRRTRRETPATPRSAKAGRPPEAAVSANRVRRRQKTARGAMTKGTTVFQTDHGPRAAWPASTSKRKKR